MRGFIPFAGDATVALVGHVREGWRDNPENVDGEIPRTSEPDRISLCRYLDRDETRDLPARSRLATRELASV
jgi:hypothetical protein